MPEETTPTTAAEIHAEILAEQTDKEEATATEDEAKTDPDEETEEASATADEGAEEDEESEPDEVDEEELASSKLKLDDNVREKFPDEAKRWDQQVKGLEKREKQLKGLEKGVETWTQVEAALSSKETAPKAAQALLKIVLEGTGLTINELLGIQMTTSDEDGKAKSKYGFEFASEDAIYEKAKADALAEMQTRFGIDSDLMTELRTEREQKKQAVADKAWFEDKGKAVIARAEKLAGWKVTQELVIKARAEYPDLFKSDPVQAMKKTDPDGYADRKKPEKPPVKDMLKGNTAQGFVSPTNPEEYRAGDAMRELGLKD